MMVFSLLILAGTVVLFELVPNGGNAKLREVPTGAEFQRARSSERRRLGICALWDFAPFGTRRRLAFFDIYRGIQFTFP